MPIQLLALCDGVQCWDLCFRRALQLLRLTALISVGEHFRFILLPTVVFFATFFVLTPRRSISRWLHGESRIILASLIRRFKQVLKSLSEALRPAFEYRRVSVLAILPFFHHWRRTGFPIICSLVLGLSFLSLLFRVNLLLLLCFGSIQLSGGHWWRHFAQANVIAACWLFHWENFELFPVRWAHLGRERDAGSFWSWGSCRH